MGVKRGEKRRMDELKMEVEVKESYEEIGDEKVEKWADHLKTMEDEKQTKPNNCKSASGSPKGKHYDTCG